MLLASNRDEAPPALFSPEFQQNPYPTYRHYQSGAALQPLPGRPNAWLLFGYEACARHIRDIRLSAARPATSLVGVPVPEMAEFEDLIQHMGRWLLMRDAPRHSVMRKQLNRGFTPVVVERLKPRVVAIIDRLLDSFETSDAIDLIRDFAYPLPVRVICELLGVPEELHARCVTLSNDIALWMGDLRRPPDRARLAQQAMRELDGYFECIIRDRRNVQKEDLLGVLMAPLEGSEPMTHQELQAQCVMLLFGGHETTRNLIGNGMMTLLRNPESFQRLRNDDSLVPSAVEEMLRYESPVQATARLVKNDLTIEGTELPAGSAITFMIGAAHRDAGQFPDPDLFDVARAHNRHLAFGGDAHVCLGSTLARLEGRLSVSSIIERFPNLRLLDEQPDWGPNFAFRGLNTLRVSI